MIGWQPISTLKRALERTTLVILWSESLGRSWSTCVGPNDEITESATHWMLPPVTGGAT